MIRNFNAHTNEDRAQMLEEIGVKRVDELFEQIPEEARARLNLKDSISELEAQKQIKKIASKNKTDYIKFIGAGAQEHFIPACVSQIAQRFEFNSAYTPYQPEISQGTLQMIYEFQSMICNLTGMDVANASVYDGATACAESLLMAVRITNIPAVLVKSSLNPEYKKVVETYLWAQDITVKYFENINDLKELNGEYACVLIQNPDYYGEISDYSEIKSFFNGKKTLLAVCADILSLTLLKPPVDYGADIVLGDVQAFGNSLNFGGPYAGYIACLDKYKRQLAGRIVGRTLDADGNQAFTLTLQTREQHIRREKATSNICSNQGLAVLSAAVYMSVMGKEGVKQAAYLSLKNAHTLASCLKKKGIEVLNKDFFNEFVIEVENSDKFIEKMKQEGVLAGVKLGEKRVLVTATELNTEEEIEYYVSKV